LKTQRLTALDATFLNFETARQPLHIGGLYIYEDQPTIAGRPGVRGLFQTLEERLHLVPRYRQRIREVPLALGHPLWVDDPDFDLTYHLRRLALPSPGGMTELLDVVGRLHSRPLDRSRPLWEMYILEGLSEGRTAVYSKIHHAMVDGIAAVDLAVALHDLDPRGTKIEPGEAFRPRELPSARDMVGAVALEAAGAALGAAGQMLRRPAQAPRDVASWAIKGTHLRELVSMLRPVPSGPLNVKVGSGRRIELASVSLDRVKAIKNALGASVNDVALAAVGEALHLFLVGRGVSVPDDLTYRIMVPVSVRNEADNGPGNKLSAMFIDMPVGRMAARRRMEIVMREMAGLKDKHQAAAAGQLLTITSMAPASLHALAGHAALSNQRLVNMVFSNVPGLQVPVYAGGARLLEAYPLLPVVANLSVVICVASYNGGMYFGVVGDYAGFPDLKVIAAGIEDGVESLERTAGLRPPKKVARTAIRPIKLPSRKTVHHGRTRRSAAMSSLASVRDAARTAAATAAEPRRAMGSRPLG
jgi:WS/DGAT/MGAT family acyltransferase